MILHILTIINTILALVDPAPATNSSLEPRLDGPTRRCGLHTMTIINQISEASPLISDCQTINKNIAKDGFWHVINADEQKQLVQYGTCAFSVGGSGGLIGFYIANLDIIDAINGSIWEYGSGWKTQPDGVYRPGPGGKVGTKGYMNCNGGKWITWALYHT